MSKRFFISKTGILDSVRVFKIKLFESHLRKVLCLNIAAFYKDDNSHFWDNAHLSKHPIKLLCAFLVNNVSVEKPNEYVAASYTTKMVKRLNKNFSPTTLF